MNTSPSSVWEIRKPSVSSRKGIVASQSRLASEVGAEILARGGNAVDAAIATSFALGAVEPWMSGIGGGGYMVVRMAGESEAKVIDFGMRSPGQLRASDYPLTEGKASDLFPWTAVVDDRNVIGPLAVAIPGQVAGMGVAATAYSTMSWRDLVMPAVNLAKAGLTVDWYTQLILSSAAKDLSKYPASASTFLDDGLFPKSSAWTALNSTKCDFSRLASTLLMIADEGADTLYKGPLANSIVNDLNAAGSRHTLEDFYHYKAELVDADSYRYRGHTVYGTPSMTAGPTLRRVLQLLETWQPSSSEPDASAYIAYDSAIRQANIERVSTMGGLSEEPIPSCTTHFSVVDGAGNVVSVTQTLLSIFGSRMMLPESGILMNNGIMWFDPEPGKANSLAPAKKCLANMCPTLLERSDGSLYALGASGGRKIMPAVAQLASFLLDYEMDLETALHAARIDASMSDVTILDDSIPAAVLKDVQRIIGNNKVAPRTIYPFHFACPSAVARSEGLNSGATEIMSPWADAVAEAGEKR